MNFRKIGERISGSYGYGFPTLRCGIPWSLYEFPEDRVTDFRELRVRISALRVQISVVDEIPGDTEMGFREDFRGWDGFLGPRVLVSEVARMDVRVYMRGFAGLQVWVFGVMCPENGRTGNIHSCVQRCVKDRVGWRWTETTFPRSVRRHLGNYQGP